MLIYHEDALSALRKLSGGGAEAVADVYLWVFQVQQRQSQGDPTTISEHTALAHMLRRGDLRWCPGPDTLHQKAKVALEKSWLHLTRKPVESDSLADRLPWSVLRRACREERLFHAAAFQGDGPKAITSQETLGRDYVPEMSDFVVAAVLLAVTFTGIGSGVLGSIVVGYAIASLSEYAMHRWAGHEAGRPIKPLLDKAGWLGTRISDYLQATYRGHFVVHHVKTCNRNYTAQFSIDPPGDQATIDAELDALGNVGLHIRRTGYGMTLSHQGVIAGFISTLPLTVLLWWLLSLDLISGISLIASSFLFVGASKVLHPYLHKSRDRALEQAGPFMGWLLRTRYVEWISRAHWVHHKGGGGNFNLVPGADFLFGDLRKPTLRMILRMREDRILGACWK